MADRGLFWSPVPDWAGASIRYPALNVTARSAPAAWLVSGNLAQFLAQHDARPCIGPREVCDGATYALRLAPDRLLSVSFEGAAAHVPGWSDSGTAVTDVGDGFVLFDVTGPAALDLMKHGADYDFAAAPAGAEESASMLFAGLKVIVARLADGWRLHVERPYATALWQRLSHAAAEWDKPPAET